MTALRTTRIYVLIDPRDDAVRYVGKTVKQLHARLRGHIFYAVSKNGKTHVSTWVRSLAALDLRPLIHQIDAVDHGWEERECYWINWYRTHGAKLTNLAEGGAGTPGCPCSTAKRAVLSEQGKKRFSNIAERNRARAAAQVRFEKTVERDKLKDAARKRDPLTRAAFFHACRNPTEATRRLNSLAQKSRAPDSPETSARRSAANRIRWARWRAEKAASAQDLLAATRPERALVLVGA